MRFEIVARIDEEGILPRQSPLSASSRIAADAATQLVEYLATGRAALGTMPTQSTIVSSDLRRMRHAARSSIRHRAAGSTGVGTRAAQRFCAKLQLRAAAAATKTRSSFRWSTSHSFELAQSRGTETRAPCARAGPGDARRADVRGALGWVAGTALALPPFRGGKKVRRRLQRMRAEDFIAAVFPTRSRVQRTSSATAKYRPSAGRQAVHDCLYESDDIEGLEQLLRGIETGDIQIVARDLRHIAACAGDLTARRYAYGRRALEERRTQA